MEVFARSEGVANLEVACVGKTDDVACISFIHSLFLLSHEGSRSRETELLAKAHVFVVDVTLKFTRTDFHEGNT